MYDHYALPDGRLVHLYQKDKMHETVVPDIALLPEQPRGLLDYNLTCLPSMGSRYWPKVTEKPIPLLQMPNEPQLPSTFASNIHLVKPMKHICTPGKICYLTGYPEDYCMKVALKVSYYFICI